MSEQTVELTMVPFRGYLIPEILKKQIEHMNQTFHWTPQMSQDDFDNPNTEYYILTRKDQVLGYVALHVILDEGTINMVYLEPDLRGQGLATYMMNFVIDQLQARGIRHLFLEVRESNHKARALYRRTGFDELTIRPNYYSNPTEHGVILQRDLNRYA